MRIVLSTAHILITVGLIGSILLQSSKGGLGHAWGGGEFYRSRRGAERIVFSATIVLSVLFLATSILNILLR